MKRKALLIPLSAIIIVVAAILLLDRHQSPPWKVELDRYLLALRQSGNRAFRLVSYASAASPANFTPAMSAESYSNSLLFAASYTLDGQITTGLEPMPYPPQEVVCVLLQQDGQQQLVYVARHTSLYNADWVVHISSDPWGSPALQSNLQTLGCSLDL